MMIRPARDADLDPIARIYDEILDLEDARPVSIPTGSAAGIPPGTPPVGAEGGHPSLGPGGEDGGLRATSMGSSSRNTARSWSIPRRPPRR